MPLNDYDIGLRVLDIEHGLREISPDAVIEGELGSTLLLGKALNLALHLRGLNVVQDIRGLTYAAAELGISSAALPTVLRALEEIAWVRQVSKNNQLQRVEILVPALRDGFEVVGMRWRELRPSEIAQASVEVLADAIVRPFEEEELLSRLGLSGNVAATMMDIGETGTYLKRHRLDRGEQLVYSPLYCDNNPEKAHAIAKKYGDSEVGKLIRVVRGEQGVPYERLLNAPLVREAALSGLVLAPAVRDKQFVFTPQKGLGPEETVILDKARAIVSCVRSGQHYAEVTKIFSPRAIVQALIDRKQLKPHSEHLEQYGLLVKKGIGLVARVGSRWQFSILDTDDNMKALRVAYDLLEVGDAVQQSIDPSAQARILNPSGSYSTPVSQRVKLSRSRKGKKADEQTIAAISELIRGARSA